MQCKQIPVSVQRIGIFLGGRSTLLALHLSQNSSLVEIDSFRTP